MKSVLILFLFAPLLSYLIPILSKAYGASSISLSPCLPVLGVHNLNTSKSFASVQEAIDAADTTFGHVIQVDPGIYFEHVTISKPVSLVGTDRDATIIDGNSTGTVILVGASYVNVVNLTVRNAGKTWTLPWQPDGCVRGNGVSDVVVWNNVLAGAAVCVWFQESSFVNVSDNLVSESVFIGVGGVNSYMRISNNQVSKPGSDGIHLDRGSSYCAIVNNTVKNGFVGISLENPATTNNLIDENNLVNNTNAIGIFESPANVFRRNNMTGNRHNIVVVGSELATFVQAIDVSNTVDSKTVYYLKDLRGQIIDPSRHPNAGYLAVVNSVDTVVKGFNFTRNGDGLILAHCANCTITNMTISGNHDVMKWGGMTFYSSNNNRIVENVVTNNSYAVCLSNSTGNLFYHNIFVNNDAQVVSDFFSPFPGGASSNVSVNDWDNGLEGNYWSNYDGSDENRDGIGDTPYAITAQTPTQSDRYALMGVFRSFNTTRGPWTVPGFVVDVISNWTVRDLTATFWLEHPDVRVVILTLTNQTETGFCRLCIPHGLVAPPFVVTINGMTISPVYVNDSVYDNGTHRWVYFSFSSATNTVYVASEFPPLVIGTTCMIISLTVAVIIKSKKSQRLLT